MDSKNNQKEINTNLTKTQQVVMFVFTMLIIVTLIIALTFGFLFNNVYVMSICMIITFFINLGMFITLFSFCEYNYIKRS